MIYLKDRATGEIKALSVAYGCQGSTVCVPNGPSGRPVVSGDGNYVVFESTASNLTASSSDGNGVADIYQLNLSTGEMKLASVANSTTDSVSSDGAIDPDVSDDGSVVVFTSKGSDMEIGDLNSPSRTSDGYDVFARRASADQTRRMSDKEDSEFHKAADNDSFGARVSGDGKYATFLTEATNVLTAGDTNGYVDVYLHTLSEITGTNADHYDRGSTVRVSYASDGGEPNGDVTAADISGDGSKVVYSSMASNVDTNDTDTYSDIFVKDLTSGTTKMVSTSTSYDATDPVISSDSNVVSYVQQNTDVRILTLYRLDTGETASVVVDTPNAVNEVYSGPNTLSSDGSTYTFWSSIGSFSSLDGDSDFDVFVGKRSKKRR